MNDPIADLLTRIRNAYATGKKTVSIPHSHVKEALAKTILENAYIESFEVVKGSPVDQIVVTLKYTNDEPAITKIIRVSRPGRRVYTPAKDLAATLGGFGVSIVSTSEGIMNSKTARKKNIGGEVICRIW